MKQLLLYSVIAILAIGCANQPTKEEIDAQRTTLAQKVIEQYADSLLTSLGSDGYVGIEFSSLDTLYSTFNDLALQEERGQADYQKWRIEFYSKYKDWDEVKDAKGKLAEFEANIAKLEADSAAFVPEMIGLSMSHKFGGKGKIFGQITIDGAFKLDTALTKVVTYKAEDFDMGDLTLVDLLQNAKIQDFLND